MLSAHDKGSHAEVHVKVRKVLHSGRTALSLGTISVYPLSWTSRGCTCPLLNPGKMYRNSAQYSFCLVFHSLGAGGQGAFSDGIVCLQLAMGRGLKLTSCLHQVWITCWQVQRRLGQDACWSPCKVWWFPGHPDSVCFCQKVCRTDVSELCQENTLLLHLPAVHT